MNYCMDCGKTAELTRYRCSETTGDWFGCPEHYDEHAETCTVCEARPAEFANESGPEAVYLRFD